MNDIDAIEAMHQSILDNHATEHTFINSNGCLSCEAIRRGFALFARVRELEGENERLTANEKGTAATVAHNYRVLTERAEKAEAEVEMLRGVVERLGSMEGFMHAGLVDKDNPWCRELLARVDFARAALSGEEA